MSLSLATLAMIDAAATVADRWSPLTRLRCGHPSPSSATKSVSTSSGSSPRMASARPMARRVASSMFTRSIVGASTIPMPIATARARMTASNSSRSSGVRSFESFTPSIRVPGPKMTAAATTGPASGPRPASSSPATRVTPRRQAACS